MSVFVKFNEHDPFVQAVFRSVAITTAGTFAVALGFEYSLPELRTPLFVPIAVAFFIGTLGFQVERTSKRLAPAILWLGAAVLLFPLASWLLLRAAHIPYEATAARFVSLIPQAVAAPPLFKLAKIRFEANAGA